MVSTIKKWIVQLGLGDIAKKCINRMFHIVRYRKNVKPFLKRKAIEFCIYLTTVFLIYPIYWELLFIFYSQTQNKTWT